MTFPHKNLLGLRFLSAEDITTILDQAHSFKDLFNRPIKQVPTLRGKTIVQLFFEPSTRTHASFEMAIKLMGAGSLTLNVQNSSVKKGESLRDTIQNLQAMGIDAVIVRHQNGGVPHFMTQHLSIPVINAGDGFTEHPTQGLLDIFTMREKLGDLKNKRVLIWGDILHSRVARSNIWGLTKLGAEVYVGGPPTLMPAGIEDMGVKIVKDFDLAIEAMDVLNILRIQHERQDIGYIPTTQEYKTYFGISESRIQKAKPNLLIMHPGPINRGIEIESNVADGPKSVILEQVTNGIAVRMATLYLLLTGGQS